MTKFWSLFTSKDVFCVYLSDSAAAVSSPDFEHSVAVKDWLSQIFVKDIVEVTEIHD